MICLIIPKQVNFKIYVFILKENNGIKEGLKEYKHMT